MWRTFATIPLLVFLHTASVRAYANLFAIAKPEFSVYVLNDGNYTAVMPAKDNIISRASLKQERVYLSFTILGFDDAMRHLHTDGRLNVETVIWAGGAERDSVDVGITQQRWAEIGKKLTSEFDADGYFTFRTFMSTKKINYSEIEIIIRDGNKNVVGHETVTIVP